MRNEVITTTATRDDIELIISALSAYKHNTKYRSLYERLRRQAAILDGREVGAEASLPGRPHA